MSIACCIRKLCIRTTIRCNLRCAFCFANVHATSAQRADLPIAVMQHVCTSLRPQGLQAVSLSGGEPFLRRDIGDVFTCVRKMGLDASVTTNGTIDLRSQLTHIKSNDIRVKVSLHGIGPIHDAIIGASVFSQASETLRLLIGERIRLTVNCMVCRMNVRHLDDLLDWIRFLGVSRIRFVRYAARGPHHVNGFLLDEVDEAFYMDWLSKVRCSPDSGLTIRTTDYSETPYFVLEVDRRLYREPDSSTDDELIKDFSHVRQGRMT